MRILQRGWWVVVLANLSIALNLRRIHLGAYLGFLPMALIHLQVVLQRTNEITAWARLGVVAFLLPVVESLPNEHLGTITARSNVLLSLAGDLVRCIGANLIELLVWNLIVLGVGSWQNSLWERLLVLRIHISWLIIQLRQLVFVMHRYILSVVNLDVVSVSLVTV